VAAVLVTVLVARSATALGKLEFVHASHDRLLSSMCSDIS